MKTLRLVLWTFGGLVLLTGMLAAVASIPGIQTWYARRLLAQNPSLGASLGSVSAGPGRVTIRDLRLHRGGIEFRVSLIEAELPVWRAVFRREFPVRRLLATGLTVDLSNLSPEGGPAELETGVLAKPRLALLVLASALPNELPGGLRGFGLSGGTAGPEMEILGAVILPQGQGLRPGAAGPLTFDLTGTPTDTGEVYAVKFFAAGRQFAEVKGRSTEATRRFAGRWKLDLTAGAAGSSAPKGEGILEAGPDEFHAAGRIEAGAGRLGRMLPNPAALDGLKVSAEFDATRRGGVWQINSLSGSLEGAHSVLRATALQEFEFNPATREAHAQDPGRDIARVTLDDVPLGWTAPWLAPFALSGGGIGGELVAAVRGGGLMLRSSGPLSADNVTVARLGRRIVDGVDLTADATIEIRPEGWQLALTPVTVRLAPDGMLTAEARVGRLAGAGQPLKIAGRLSADLPALLSRLPNGCPGDFRRGDLTCEFTGSLGLQSSIEAKVGLDHLEAGPSGMLPEVNAEIRADIGEEGRTTFNAPLRIGTGAGGSDLTVAGTLACGSMGTGIDLQVSGEHLTADGAELLATPLGWKGFWNGRPFWCGAKGKLAFALKSASWPGRPALTDLEGTLGFDPNGVTIAGVRGKLGGGRFLLAGQLHSGADASRPFSYRLDLRLENLDSAPFFRALSPGRAPTFQGRFDLRGSVAGDCADIRDIPGPANGDWTLTSKGGVFRALRKAIDVRPEPTDKIAVIGAFIGNVADTVTFRKDAKSQDMRARAAADFSQIMTALPYDRVDVTLSHDALGNIVFREFSLISPEIRIEGSGTVVAVDGFPVLEQPVEASLRLRVRGHAAELLEAAGLLSQGRDDLGYTASAIPLEVGGTLLAPDLGAFRDALLKAAQ